MPVHPASHRFAQRLLGGALFVGAAGAGLAPSSDGDVWWHLAAGREMARTGALLHNDPFSVSAFGRPWPDVHWLFQLGAYAVHQLGGLTALVVVKCLLVGLSALTLFAALNASRSAQALFVPLFLAALFAARSLLLVRPVIVTLCFLASYFFVLERHRNTGRARALAWLPVAQLVWANCQGLSLLGPALVAAYAVGAVASEFFAGGAAFSRPVETVDAVRQRREIRPLLWSLGLCSLASFMTPFGVEAAALPGKLLTRLVPYAGNVYAPNVAENVPPLWLEQLSPGHFAHFKWYLALLALCIAVSAARMAISHMLVVAGFVVLALLANRNVLLLYWIATPIVALNLAPVVARVFDAVAGRHALRAASAAASLAVGAALAAILVVAAREPTLADPAPFRMPVQSASLIAALPGEGTIFSADHQGGYLIWQLYPRFRPFMDTRLVLRTPEEFAEYLQIADDPQRFDALQQRQGFSYVVLPTAYPSRYLRLIAHLYGSADWRLRWTDGSEVLFARRDVDRDDATAWDLGSSATTERILSNASARYARSPELIDAARLQLATLDLAVGEYGQCDTILSDEREPIEHGVRARCRLASGDLDGARQVGERMLQANADDLNGLDVLAMVHARRGERQRAVGFLRRALAIDPLDIEATSLLASMEEQRHANP